MTMFNDKTKFDKKTTLSTIAKFTSRRLTKLRLKKLFAISAILMASQPLYAQVGNTKLEQAEQIDQTINQKEILELLVESELAYHPSWLRLLHYPDYERGQEPATVSRVKKSDFFVSAEGQHDPQAELKEMVTSLLSKNDALKGDDSVQCRFPARTHWLREQLGLVLPTVSCTHYDNWFKQYQPEQLSIMFAQEYPDSMTSAFAHTLLRIDTSKNPQANNFKDAYALNYTVDGNPNDSMPAYALKSMTGKYAGLMTIESYLPKLEDYLVKDNRDVWTYPLKLTKAESAQIIRHVWEVKDVGLPYYFLTDNCASEILRFIDVVRPAEHLYDAFSKFVVPNEVIRLLDEKGLLEQGDFLPAVASQKQAKLNGVIAQQDAQTSPTQGAKLQRATIALGQAGTQTYAQVGARVSYHDLLDREIGYRKNLDMDTLNLKIRAYDVDEKMGTADKVQLQELTILRGRSYHPINTARDGGSWGVDFGLKQVNDASEDFSKRGANHNPQKNELRQQHLVANLGVEKGVSVAFGKVNSQYDLPQQLCYAFGAGNVQGGKGLTNGFRLGVGANLGCVYRMNDKLRATAEVNVPYWYHTDTSLTNHKQGYWQPTASIGMQYDMATNHSLRVTADYELSDRVEADTDMNVSYNWYF
ncbi:DUF4105 domain-containing protein [Psychrobacter sp. HD31]|uniref:Lnb N-terminal periplasmic domain-containing protein n=1 Tax=Psychrobacter sp. HD31 TaxID=3112003 RepID=UPI003DA696B4